MASPQLPYAVMRLTVLLNWKFQSSKSLNCTITSLLSSVATRQVQITTKEREHVIIRPVGGTQTSYWTVWCDQHVCYRWNILQKSWRKKMYAKTWKAAYFVVLLD